MTFALLLLRRRCIEQEEGNPKGQSPEWLPERKKWNMRAVGALHSTGLVALAVVVAFSCQVGLLGCDSLPSLVD